MTKYEYYKTMQDLCLEIVKLNKSDGLTKSIYKHASEGFEIKALNLNIKTASLPITEEQQKIFNRFSAQVQIKKNLENW